MTVPIAAQTEVADSIHGRALKHAAGLAAAAEGELWRRSRPYHVRDLETAADAALATGLLCAMRKLGVRDPAPHAAGSLPLQLVADAADAAARLSESVPDSKPDASTAKGEHRAAFGAWADREGFTRWVSESPEQWKARLDGDDRCRDVTAEQACPLLEGRRLLAVFWEQGQWMKSEWAFAQMDLVLDDGSVVTFDAKDAASEPRDDLALDVRDLTYGRPELLHELPAFFEPLRFQTIERAAPGPPPTSVRNAPFRLTLTVAGRRFTVGSADGAITIQHPPFDASEFEAAA